MSASAASVGEWDWLPPLKRAPATRAGSPMRTLEALYG